MNETRKTNQQIFRFNLCYTFFRIMVDLLFIYLFIHETNNYHEKSKNWITLGLTENKADQISFSRSIVNIVNSVLCDSSNNQVLIELIEARVSNRNSVVRNCTQRFSNCEELWRIAQNWHWIGRNCAKLRAVYKARNCAQVKSTCVGNPNRNFSSMSNLSPAIFF